MTMTCKKCGEEFELKRDHRGLINVCHECGGEDVPRLRRINVSGGKCDNDTQILDEAAFAEHRRLNRATPFRSK